MSEISTEVPTTPGTPTLGEVYWRAAMTDMDDISAWPTLRPEHQADIERGARAVADHVASSGYQGPAQHTYTDACDGFHEPGQDCNLAAEPGQPAKVIVVTDDTGRDRRYAADAWEAEEAVDLIRKGDVIVTYPQGTWRRATVEGAELDGVRPTAVRLQAALRQVAMVNADTTVDILQRIARDELERSGWDEEDL